MPPKKGSLGGGGWFRPCLDHPPSLRESDYNKSAFLADHLVESRSRRGKSADEWKCNE